MGTIHHVKSSPIEVNLQICKLFNLLLSIPSFWPFVKVQEIYISRFCIVSICKLLLLWTIFSPLKSTIKCYYISVKFQDFTIISIYQAYRNWIYQKRIEMIFCNVTQARWRTLPPQLYNKNVTVWCHLRYCLTLPPMGYRILWLPWGGGPQRPPLRNQGRSHFWPHVAI